VKKAAILALTMLALPAMAQDQRVSLVFDQTKHEDTTFTTGGSSANLSVDKTTAIGIRYGIAAAHFWNGALEFEGTIRPRSGEKDLKLNGTSASSSTQSLQISDEYAALGVGMRWAQVVDFGFMFEDRQEFTDFHLKDNTGFDYTQRTGVNRLWLRANVGYTFQIQAPVKPFVNFSYGFALGKKGTDTGQLQALSASSYSQNFVIDFYSRSVLPKSDLQFEAGIRF